MALPNSGPGTPEERGTAGRGVSERGLPKKLNWRMPAEDPPQKQLTPEERSTVAAVKDWLLTAIGGEFVDDQTLGQMAFDTALSMVPGVDQLADARDLIAQAHRVGWKGEHKDPLRWVSIAFTLIGLFPEIGSFLKGLSKVLLKELRTLGEPIVQLLKRAGSSIPLGADGIQLLSRSISKHWASWVSQAQARWLSLLDGLSRTAGAVSAQVRERIAWLREISPQPLKEAFAEARRLLDEFVSAVSPPAHLATAGGPPIHLATASGPPTSLPARSAGATPSGRGSRPGAIVPDKGSKRKLGKAHASFRGPRDKQGRPIDYPMDKRVSGTGGISTVTVEILEGGAVGVTIEGKILPARRAEPKPGQKKGDVERCGYEDHLASKGDTEGFKDLDYDRAHLWGPVLGDEAAEGVMYAPAHVNRAIQLALEKQIASIKLKPNEVLTLKAKATSFPRGGYGHETLQTVEYNLATRNGDKTDEAFSVSVTLSPPPEGKVVSLKIGGVDVNWQELF